jgi:hypothetical protein
VSFVDDFGLLSVDAGPGDHDGIATVGGSAHDHIDRLGASHDRIRPGTEHSILLVRPESALDKERFVQLAVDRQSGANGDLAGVIISAPAFAGWDSFGAMVTHFRFVRDHQKHIKKVAVVTDSHLADVAEHLGSHFVSARIQHFPAGQIEQARQRIIDGS